MYDFIIDEQGMASVEYALLVSLIGMVIAGSLHVIGAILFRNFYAIDGVLSLVHLSDDSLKSRK